MKTLVAVLLAAAIIGLFAFLPPKAQNQSGSMSIRDIKTDPQFASTQNPLPRQNPDCAWFREMVPSTSSSDAKDLSNRLKKAATE